MARIIRSWWEEITGVSTFLSLGILKRFIYSILSYTEVFLASLDYTHKSVYHLVIHGMVAFVIPTPQLNFYGTASRRLPESPGLFLTLL